MDKRPESEVIIIDTEEGQRKVRVAREVLANHSRAELALLVADHFRQGVVRAEIALLVTDHLRQGVVVEEAVKIEPPVFIVPEKYKNFHDFSERKRKPARKGRNKWYRSMK